MSQLVCNQLLVGSIAERAIIHGVLRPSSAGYGDVVSIVDVLESAALTHGIRGCMFWYMLVSWLGNSCFGRLLSNLLSLFGCPALPSEDGDHIVQFRASVVEALMIE